MSLTKLLSIATAAILTLSLIAAPSSLAVSKKAKTVKVTFNANGGTKNATKSYKLKAKLGTLPKVTRAGYTFAGWYTAKSGGKKVTKTTKTTKKVTFYAHWTANAVSSTATPAPSPIVTVVPTKPPTATAPPTTPPTVAPSSFGFAPSVIEFAGYEWLVLDTAEDGSQFVISKDVIDIRAYNEEGGHYDSNNNWVSYDGGWADSDLRAYLNGEWFDRLSPANQARVKTTHVSNNDNPWYGTLGGNDTEDKVFLLSLEEVVKYFGDSGAMTDASAGKLKDRYFSDEYNQNRIADLHLTAERITAIAQYLVERGKYDALEDAVADVEYYNHDRIWWWLRSPGRFSGDAANLHRDGSVVVGGNNVNQTLFDFGVRPAMWLAA